MIRIDAVWLAAEPVDMRAGVDRLLARVVHIDGLDSQPHGVNADHFSSSRSHCAHSAAAALG